MAKDLLTDDELARLADQVDEELQRLANDPSLVLQRSGSGEPSSIVPYRQRQAIEEATGEPAESFWQKYKRAARKDLCHADGLLYKQWHQFRELQSKDAVKVAYGLLAGLGISGAALPIVAVATSVILVSTVTNIGINAICADEPEAGKEGES